VEAVLLQDGDIIQVALAMKLVFVGTESTIPLDPGGASSLGLGRLRMDPQASRWVDQASSIRRSRRRSIACWT
jgi:hypothetical protein